MLALSVFRHSAKGLCAMALPTTRSELKGLGFSLRQGGLRIFDASVKILTRGCQIYHDANGECQQECYA